MTEARSGFEGSYLGASDRITAQAVMECKICWTPYDPAEGDDTRQVLPGTAFADLPQDWSCPSCGAPRAQFMVLADPGSHAAAEAAEIARLTALLTADFREIWHAKMRDLPMVNTALHVEAVGFRPWQGGYLGVLVAPWFMNLVLLPGPDEDWSELTPGEKEVVGFPSGDYEFIHNRREMVGGYKACSLFSPMAEFASQLQAVEVARAVMAAIFEAEHRAETDRAAEIRAAREADLAPPTELGDPGAAEPVAARSEAEAAPSRRALLTGGFVLPPTGGG